MNLVELANRERELYEVVTSLQGTMEEKIKQLKERGVFEEYRRIHQQYAQLHNQETEALKRGLFLTWYSTVEPPCFTGIKELDSAAENQIISTLDRQLEQGIIDYELDWMLSYYANLEFAFERFKGYESLQKKLQNPPLELPRHIDNEGMLKRGQMGLYWNSLEVFNK
ncbi:hypothetical protein OCK74_27270 [Chitinophagaceae bacterium LB-8]|uniref:Uncharacterized protein n=1 Tax=Paraflavisolibacter caeni TaxID=2982496 RepID=A0A9X2Y173_9BACT|nr:hypothetical protein [Paraflavisolibacter caeni]MCU7552850.1 hypothetical protein [Paraflavisolibacter caeni]